MNTGLLRQLAGLGFRKGIKHGSRTWLALGVLSWFMARTREKSRQQPPPLYREVLRPGEAVAIRILKPPR